MSETAKMNVYRKLQLARVLLQNTRLNKSGKNKFAGYEYFELGDFIPAIQVIFEDVGLCGVITYTLRFGHTDHPQHRGRGHHRVHLPYVPG
jgi:hypothetical protein